MEDNWRLLRYNTGTDKQVLVEFKNDFSAIIFNATIVAYSRSAVADIVSVHKNKYIIDPQTHIFQQDIKNIQTQNKSGTITIKKSVLVYLDELPAVLKNKYIHADGRLSASVIEEHIDDLVDSVYHFETEYVNKYVKSKEYDKYLAFAQIGPKIEAVIAPYFMIKSSYTKDEIDGWISLNVESAQKFLEKNNNAYPMGVQIVIDKEVLLRPNFVDSLCRAYKDVKAEFVFIWIDDFNLFEVTNAHRVAFKKLLECFTLLNMKPIMAYGGYDAIMLCHRDLTYRMYGVAQSVGYGENRAVTPVGGGIPVNKYYFYPLHRRLKMVDVIRILNREKFWNKDPQKASELFYSMVCSCKQCKNIIRNNIKNFNLYNDSTAYTLTNGIKRNRPTFQATLFAARHFMYSKIREWKSLEEMSFEELKEELKRNYQRYAPEDFQTINEWCKIYD